VHGIGAGSDSRATWLAAIYVVSVASVLAALAWRILRNRAGSIAVAGATTLAALAGIVLTVAVGSLPHGSSGKHRVAATVPSSIVTDAFAGSVTQQNGSSAALVSVLGRGTGTRALAVRIDLVTADGQSIDSSSLQVKDVTSGSICTGTVASIGASGFSGSCSFPGGASRSVSGTWQLASDRTVSGRVSLGA
jgi:hypothetical protein